MNFEWLDFVNAPVFVLGLPGPLVLRTNEALRRMLGRSVPDMPTPLPALIGSNAADAVRTFIDAMPASVSRNTLSALFDRQRHGQSHPAPKEAVGSGPALGCDRR